VGQAEDPSSKVRTLFFFSLSLLLLHMQEDMTSTLLFLFFPSFFSFDSYQALGLMETLTPRSTAHAGQTEVEPVRQEMGRIVRDENGNVVRVELGEGEEEEGWEDEEEEEYVLVEDRANVAPEELEMWAGRGVFAPSTQMESGTNVIRGELVKGVGEQRFSIPYSRTSLPFVNYRGRAVA
jgi:hypothetical protein